MGHSYIQPVRSGTHNSHTVFFHTVAVTSSTVTLMQLKGGGTQGRQLRQMQVLSKELIFMQCTYCSDCVFPQLQSANQRSMQQRSW